MQHMWKGFSKIQRYKLDTDFQRLPIQIILYPIPKATATMEEVRFDKCARMGRVSQNFCREDACVFEINYLSSEQLR